jgi:hypothetical protein
MDHLDPEQWRVLSYLHGQRGQGAPLRQVVKAQGTNNDCLFDLEGRGLIQATVSGNEIELPVGHSRYARQIRIRLTRAGRFRCDNDPLPRVVRALNRTTAGLTLTFLLGVALLDDLTEMARGRLIDGADDAGEVDLSSARPVNGMTYRIALPGGQIAYPEWVLVQLTARGCEYAAR